MTVTISTAGTTYTVTNTVSYSTSFPANETPISEGGAWVHNGTSWFKIDTSGGLAFGTQPGDGSFTDSYAYLKNFPANQKGTATVFKSASIDTTNTHEWEILLRWADTTSTARGYECNLAFNGAYSQIVRWNGALGDFTQLSDTGNLGHTINTGDIFEAQIVGNLITTRLNGTVLQTFDVTTGAGATGSVWNTGNPGMGFWRGSGAGFDQDHGFTHYAAVSL